jgi:protein-L-isoaspartate(D-aspartate) O-methyltransferase
MSADNKRFPLSLASLDVKPARSPQSARAATPQTATRNAAETLSRQARTPAGALVNASPLRGRQAWGVDDRAGSFHGNVRQEVTFDGARINASGPGLRNIPASTTGAVSGSGVNAAIHSLAGARAPAGGGNPAARQTGGFIPGAGAAGAFSPAAGAVPRPRQVAGGMAVTPTSIRDDRHGEDGKPLVSDGVRHAMVARIARQGVKDEKVLRAMGTVPRHLFLESGMAGQAYVDASLPIGHQQTISQPYIVARMIEVMRQNAHGGRLDKVLEIGTGCGYQAAVLSQVAREVYSVERIRALHELAKRNLRPLRVANIRLHYGDGMLGFPQVAPFDGIILAAAGLEVPRALLEQLAVGGRLVAPVGASQQVLQVIERINKYEWNTVTLEECHFVPLRPGTSG